METIAWIPLLNEPTGRVPPDEEAVSIPVGAAAADSSPDGGAPRPDRARPVAGHGRRQSEPRGAHWQTVMILAVAATVVWVLAWRNERVRLEWQRRQGERVASRPAAETAPERSVVR